MLKIIHTADWHLGQSFFDYDRREEHINFLSWLHEQIDSNQIDLLLIAGDIFDSPNPSAESQKMYYRFLCDVTANNPNIQIIIIAGNHDSASRLEAPNPIFENINITVRGIVKRTSNNDIDYDYLTIPITKGGYCLAVPFLRQGDYPCADSYAQGVGKMYKEIFDRIKDSDQPIIAMGHLQATGSEISENDYSERKIIGGLECISPDSFSKSIKYTALGHLHRGQQVSGRENIRYSGAPLPMSFAERNNRQGVVLVTIDNATTIERIEYNSPVKLISIPKEAMPLNVVLEELNKLPEGIPDEYSPFLEVKVLITQPEPSLKFQIEKALESKAVKLARTTSVTLNSTIDVKTRTYEELQNIDPTEMAVDIFKRRFGTEDMPENLKSLLQSVIREIEK